jgi:uncharacterized protein YbjT (DUF2867 family)
LRNYLGIMSYKAIIVGASGLIGSNLLKILLAESSYTEITVLVRKPTGIFHPKLKEVVVDFDKLNDYADEINGHALFCCLGTTKARTPDEQDYRRIDHDYPVKLAQLVYQNGVKQYHLVSSLGAGSNSSFFYTRLKGETEEDIKKVGLKILHIYQPSLLIGERKEQGLLEKIAVGLMPAIDPLLVGRLRKYRSIPAKTVAMAMFKQSINSDEGVYIHLSDQIKQIA